MVRSTPSSVSVVGILIGDGDEGGRVGNIMVMLKGGNPSPTCALPSAHIPYPNLVAEGDGSGL